MKNKKPIIAALILAVVVAVLFGVYSFTKPKTEEGSKEVTVQVVDNQSR